MATIELVGSLSGIVKYIGTHTMFVPKTMICYFHSINDNRICVNCGSLCREWEFDNEAQRDAAITTLLTYF